MNFEVSKRSDTFNHSSKFMVMADEHLNHERPSLCTVEKEFSRIRR